MRRYTAVLKANTGMTQPVMVEAEDVELTWAGEDENGRPIDYNFLVWDEDAEENISVARIPFDHVLCINKV